MVHERYVIKNGKRYGPYLYHSYRDSDGKVKKHYIKAPLKLRNMEYVLFVFGALSLGFSAFMLSKLFLIPLI